MTREASMGFLLLLCFYCFECRGWSDSKCEWPHETAVSLDLNNPKQQRHLSRDAQTGEDIAIRYADSLDGLHSGHFEGVAQYAQTREQCMKALFAVIGNTHGVTQEQIRKSMMWRRTSLDLMVILSFAVFYGLAANDIARRLWRRFPLQEGWIEGTVATLVVSAVFSAGGVLLGEVWSGVAEVFRVGNSHLSYRADRIPWTQHRLGLFIAGVVLFWFVAAFQQSKLFSDRPSASQAR